MHLGDLLAAAASGRAPAPDGGVTVVEPPDPRSVGVFAFTAHHVISARVSPNWVRSMLPPRDLAAPLNPPFLTALAARTALAVNNIDAVFVATTATGPALPLRPSARIMPGAGTGWMFACGRFRVGFCYWAGEWPAAGRSR